MQVDTRADTMKNIASYFSVNTRKLQRHYKHKVSGYKEWVQLSHAEEYLIYPENITEHVSIDEVSLSKGELYTVVTNKNIKAQNKKSVIAIINGTEAKIITEVLEKIPLEKRNKVKEITMDMAPNMAMAARNSFTNSTQVIDRFHVVRLVMDALQHMRTNLRWKAIDEENQAIKTAKAEGRKYKPEILSNGDTLKELLVRSKYLLYKFEEEWTINQSKRASVLFEKYPLLKKAYKLIESFRTIFKLQHKEDALIRFNQWKQKAIELKTDEFNSVVNSIEHHIENILNFFNNRNTNANAESFNSKIKHFRANLRGVTDVKFFLFRLEKLFA
jgi:transposase